MFTTTESIHLDNKYRVCHVCKISIENWTLLSYGDVPIEFFVACADCSRPDSDSDRNCDNWTRFSILTLESASISLSRSLWKSTWKFIRTFSVPCEISRNSLNSKRHICRLILSGRVMLPDNAALTSQRFTRESPHRRFRSSRTRSERLSLVSYDLFINERIIYQQRSGIPRGQCPLLFCSLALVIWNSCGRCLANRAHRWGFAPLNL